MKFISMFLSAIMICSIGLFAKSPKKLVNSCIYISSYTETNEIAANISNAGFLKKIIISSASADGNIQLYDRIGSTVSAQIGVIDTGTLGEYNYDVALSSGLTYNSNGISAGISIIYRTM